MFLPIILLAVGLVAAGDANVQPVPYRQDSLAMEGQLVLPASPPAGKLPGIVLMPDWMGVSPQAIAYAKRISEWGYAVLVADLYGKGAQPKNAKDAGKLSAALKGNTMLMRKRAAAALEALKQQAGVDGDKIATVGFCFGGMASLELARSGAPLQGIVSVHGNLTTPLPGDTKNIHGKVLVLQGADDPYATPAQAQTFAGEMKQAGVDWQMIYYGGAVHGFTNPGSGTDVRQGLAYNAKADRRAFAVMKDFLAEAL